MKIYISADIEGISGIVQRTQLNPQGHDYQRARVLMTNEVNAAIQGVLNAGATEVIVNDSHGPMTNLLIEKLNSAVKLITGTPKRLGMVEGIDTSFDAAIFIGYHGRMNTSGVLSHSYHGGLIWNISINGVDVGEFGFNAFVAGYYNVPVVAVSGDDILAKEVCQINDQIETIIVKTARGRYTAQCIHPSTVGQMLQNKIEKAVRHYTKIKPCMIQGPIDLEVTFLNSGMAEAAAIMPGAELTAANRVLYKAENIIEAYRARMAMTLISSNVL